METSLAAHTTQIERDGNRIHVRLICDYVVLADTLCKVYQRGCVALHPGAAHEARFAVIVNDVPLNATVLHGTSVPALSSTNLRTRDSD